MSSEVLRPGLSIGRRARTQILHLPVAFPVALVLGTLISLLYLNQASVVATTGYEVRGLEAERQQWQIRNQQLKLEAAQLRSLERIEAEARKLGLGPPERRIFVTRKATAADWVTSPSAEASAPPEARPEAQAQMSPLERVWQKLAGDIVLWVEGRLGVALKPER